MKKSILNLGKTLSRVEQKSINGGVYDEFNKDELCICFTINYVYDENGLPMYSTGFSAIIPTPVCCLPS